MLVADSCRRIAALFAAVVLVSCTPIPTKVSDLFGDPLASEEIEGIDQILDQLQSKRIQGVETSGLRVLLIHGMGTQTGVPKPGTDDENAYDDKVGCTFKALIANITWTLDYEQYRPDSDAAPILCSTGLKVYSPQVLAITGGDATAQVYTFSFRSRSGRPPIIFTYLRWADLVASARSAMTGIDRPKPPVDGWLDRVSKSFIETRLVDAVLYAGTFKAVMRQAVEQALCIHIGGKIIDSGQGCERTDSRDFASVVITHSLGGYMFAETVNDVTKLAEHEAKKPPGQRQGQGLTPIPHFVGGKQELQLQHVEQLVLNKTQHVFMLANQIALLDTSTFTQPPSFPPKPLRECPRFSKAANTFEPILFTLQKSWVYARANNFDISDPDIVRRQVVAVSDPNDVLSWAVPAWAVKCKSNVTWVNVSVGTANNYAGFGANPGSAHDNYRRDFRVSNIISCGIDKGLIKRCGPHQ